MAVYTAGDQINRALRLLGVLAEGETTSASVSQDSLMALNQMIDSWNTERLSIFNTIDQTFTWPAGEIQLHLGPSGTQGNIVTAGSFVKDNTYTIASIGSTDFKLIGAATNTVGQLFVASGAGSGTGTAYASIPGFDGLRPVLLDDSTYFRDPQTNVSFGIKFINQQQYDGIAVKTVTSTYPQVMWINMEYPNIQMTVYPKPTRDLEWHFISVQELDQPANLATNILFPPGYLRAFTYNLAMEIAPEFGVEPSPQVQRIAMTSKRNLKRINNPDDIMSMPYALVANRQRFNIYAGNY